MLLPLAEVPPWRAKVDYMPCCEHQVHTRCWKNPNMPCCEHQVHTRCWKNPNICPACKTGLQPLPCKQRIESWGGDSRETKFIEEWEKTIPTSHLCDRAGSQRLQEVVGDMSTPVLFRPWILCAELFKDNLWYWASLTLFVLGANRPIVFVFNFLLCNSVHVGSL